MRAITGSDEGLTAKALYRAVLLAFGLTVVVLIFPALASLLLLVMLVVVIAVPMTAATDRLERRGVPRALGAVLSLLVVLAAVAGLVALLVPIVVREADHLVSSLPSIVDSLRKDLHVASGSGNPGTSVQSFVRRLGGDPQKLLGPAAAIGAGVVGLLTSLIVVAVTAVFTAIRPEPLVRGVVRLFPPPRRGQVRHVMHRLAGTYIGWLKGLLVGMAILGVLTYLGLLAIGVPFAIVFATLTAVAMVVPYFGALLSAIPPVIVALTISPGKALLVVALYVATHLVEGQLIEPLVMARAVALHPAVVAVGVIAVERLFGAVGLLVAVPILATLKVLAEELWVRPMERRERVRAGPRNGSRPLRDALTAERVAGDGAAQG